MGKTAHYAKYFGRILKKQDRFFKKDGHFMKK